MNDHSAAKPSAAMRLYDLAWAGVALILPRLAPRLREGFAQRLLEGFPTGRRDLWIQAASGGEAYLAWELLRRLEPGRPLSVLATSNTPQGLSVLASAASELARTRPELSLVSAYFPLDRPSIMRRALDIVAPKVVVLLETELWPGLLCACAERDVPAVLVNGRMSPRSLSRYLLWPSFWRGFAPTEILTVSEADADRYARLFGAKRVGRMHNIKFDRASEAGPAAGNGLPPGLPPPGGRFAVFGSVRKEEEEAVLRAIRLLIERRPSTVIGLFPRHMERVGAWSERLKSVGLPYVLRSSLAAQDAKIDLARCLDNTSDDGARSHGQTSDALPSPALDERVAKSPRAPSGGVILWDAFGELGSAYALADAVFVGGSLAPLGGQNFLEPLAAGVIPVIGPHWKNFAWVGQEIVAEKLLDIAESPEAVADAMFATLATPPKRDDVRARLARYLAERRGGAQKACQRIASYL